MMKKPTLKLAFVAIAITALSGSSMARNNNGYEPLFWNGPAGYGDYNILFTGPDERSFVRFILKNRGRSAGRQCSFYKNKYLRTGKKKWLRKYRICRVDNY